MDGPIERLRRRAGVLLRHRAVEREMDEEMRHHIELEAEELARAGVPREEARRRARLAFGAPERHKEAARSSRGLRRWEALRASGLDFKLGFRMLVRYPGLTVVGGLAMAFAIAIGAATFEFVTQFVFPTLPLPGGDRIVAVRNWDAAANQADDRALHDFATWRAELRSVDDLGAYRHVERNLVAGQGGGEPVKVAEISPAAFRLTRVPPLLGRPLVEGDDAADAPAVVVIGHDLWRSRFGGAPGVVGRTVRLGGAVHTVVGVMPEGYAFPFAHGVWVPLRASALEHAPGAGPAIRVFGRLAPGVSLEEARAELATLGRRAAADFPQTHEHLRPQLLPYAASHMGVSGWESVGIMSGNLVLVLLLVLVYGNVALLLLARAATRESEIVVRSALGASQRRIVGQLVAEALVLGGVATVVGLAAAALALRAALDALPMIEEELPFWFSPRLSPATLLYAATLTLLGGVLMGVVPALKVTRGLAGRLKQASAGGGMRFGGVWTAVIVLQVAVTVAVPAHAVYLRGESAAIRSLDVGIPTHRYLSARLEPDRDPPAGPTGRDTSGAAVAARAAGTFAALARRLAAEPEVAGVTFADRLPGMIHPRRQVELDDPAPDSAPPGCYGRLAPRASCAASASVAADYFEVLGAPVVQGRGFHAGDVRPDARVVVVTRSFVERVLGGRSPLGRRVRYVEPRTGVGEPQPWHEIVGVVDDLGTITAYDEGDAAAVYHPLVPGTVAPVHVAVRVRGEAAAFAPRLRTIAAAADPTLRLHQVAPLDRIHDGVMQWLSFLFWLTVVGIAIAVVLSLAGIYAVMSFTVARRTREIGIRIALGADRRRLVAAVFRRPLAQVALGVALGAVLVALAAFAELGTAPTPRQGAQLAAYAALMFGVCLLACVVPTRRALRVEPTEALRAEG